MKFYTFKKKTFSIWSILKVMLAGSLIIFVLSKTNLPDLVKTLQNTSIPWLIVSTVLFILMTLLKTLQYHILMRNEMSYFQVLNLIIWQNTVSNYFLTGAGIATYITMTRMEHEMKVSRSVTTFLLTKAGDLIAIWIVLLVSAILLWSQIAQLQLPVLFLILVIGAVMFAFFLTVLLRQRFIAILVKLFDRIGLSGLNFVKRFLNYFQSLANMDRSKTLRILSTLTLCSFVYLATSLAWVYANYAVFHLHMEPVIFIFVSVLMQLVSYVPVVVFGGLGLTESSSLYFFGMFGVSQATLAPVLVGSRILFYLLNLLPLIYLPLYVIFQRNKLQSN